MRSVPNFPTTRAFDVLDGVIETDWWHGPLLINLRFRSTGTPVVLKHTTPLFAAVPIPSSALDHNAFTMASGLGDSTEELAQALDVRDPAKPGGYARETHPRSKERTRPPATSS